MPDLKDDEGLKNACSSLIEQVMSSSGNQDWITEFQAWIIRVRDVSHDEFSSEKFQLSLWNTEAVSATGQGRIDISAAAKSTEITESLWQLKLKYAETKDFAENELLIAEAWRVIAAVCCSSARVASHHGCVRAPCVEHLGWLAPNRPVTVSPDTAMARENALNGFYGTER